MASEVQICNDALAFIGIPAIVALSDNSKPARQCNLIFDDKRDYLLRSFEWKFATIRTNLAPLTAAPAFEWSYQFQLPSNCLKLLYVGDAYGYDYPYKLENNKILAEYDVLYIRYTKQVEDTNDMDVLFRAALSAFLTTHLTTALGVKEEYEKCLEDYETKIADARFAGSIEDPHESIVAEDWLESRL